LASSKQRSLLTVGPRPAGFAFLLFNLKTIISSAIVVPTLSAMLFDPKGIAKKNDFLQ
jgi:hypothetical protein